MPGPEFRPAGWFRSHHGISESALPRYVSFELVAVRAVPGSSPKFNVADVMKCHTEERGETTRTTTDVAPANDRGRSRCVWRPSRTAPKHNCP